MKVYILGRNNDDKGAQLEELTRQLLEFQGFSNITKNTQHSGASEIDVRAEKTDSVGIREIKTPVICECKAYNKPIDMTDWLKFIGKLYIERKKGHEAEHTIGLMISLFGANGCVQGSFRDDFADDERIQLITNDELYYILSKLYSVKKTTKVKELLNHNHGIQCWDIDIAYFEKKCYLIVSLDNSKYTICNTSGELMRGQEVEEIVPLINTWTSFSQEMYEDVWANEETTALLRIIESNILTGLFSLGNLTLDDIQKHIVYSDSKGSVPKEQIKEAALHSRYVSINDANTLSLTEIDDIIPFIAYVYKIGMQVELFSSEKFQNMIGLEFLEQIKLVQYGLDLNNQERSDCLFLIKHSPSALLYTINADEFLHSYKSIAATNSDIKRLMHNHFFRQLVKLFEEDFYNPVFSSMMRNKFSIAELNNRTTICLQTKEDKRQISFEQKLLLVPMQGFQQPILLSHILEK